MRALVTFGGPDASISEFQRSTCWRVMTPHQRARLGLVRRPRGLPARGAPRPRALERRRRCRPGGRDRAAAVLSQRRASQAARRSARGDAGRSNELEWPALACAWTFGGPCGRWTARTCSYRSAGTGKICLTASKQSGSEWLRRRSGSGFIVSDSGCATYWWRNETDQEHRRSPLRQGDEPSARACASSRCSTSARRRRTSSPAGSAPASAPWPTTSARSSSSASSIWSTRRACAAPSSTTTGRRRGRT